MIYLSVIFQRSSSFSSASDGHGMKREPQRRTKYSDTEKRKTMKKRILSVILCAILIVALFPASISAAKNTDDIIILYENDVHCAVEGYSILSALKKELLETYEHVGVVSSGDFVQGGPLGSVSKGEYIIELMNLVGYDAITLGNHEFDYTISRLDELVALMDTKPICCNFQKIGEDTSYFDPYSIISYGEVKVAYVGITTPSTVSSTPPAQYKDENGNFIFTFNPDTYSEILQKNVDAALAEGADYVVVLSHVGDQEPIYSVMDMISKTTGVDVFLDAHSHSVIEGKTLTNAIGEEVIFSSTGTQFNYIGKLTLSENGITTELISTKEYQKTDPVVDEHLTKIKEKYDKIGNRVIGRTEVDLIMQDENGNRLSRTSETNIGNLCADAFRTVMDTDISLMNGGNIRTNIMTGDILFNDLLALSPFNNTVVVSEIKAQTLRDMLEMAMMSWPEESGSFPHMAGITFSVNTSIPSSVVLDKNEDFVKVDGEYRVYDIKIFDKETGKYEPLDPTKTYTIAATNFLLLECRSGMTMLGDTTMIRNDGMLDIEVIERYIVDHLGGVVGEQYATAQTHITFTKADPLPPSDGQTTDGATDAQTKAPADNLPLIIGLSSGAVIILGVAIFVVAFKIKKKKQN